MGLNFLLARQIFKCPEAGKRFPLQRLVHDFIRSVILRQLFYQINSCPKSILPKNQPHLPFPPYSLIHLTPIIKHEDFKEIIKTEIGR
jgi:hypothetical protein